MNNIVFEKTKESRGWVYQQLKFNIGDREVNKKPRLVRLKIDKERKR